MYGPRSHITSDVSRGPTPPPNTPVSGPSRRDSFAPDELRKALDAVHVNNTGGLIKALVSSCRPKNNLSTAHLLSAQPSGRTQVNRPDTGKYFTGYSQEYSIDNSFDYRNIYGRQNNSPRNNGPDSKVKSAQSNQPNYHSLQNARQQPAKDDHVSIQERIYSLAQTISGHPGLSPLLIASLTGELRDLSQSFLTQNEILNKERKSNEEVQKSHITTVQEQRQLHAKALKDHEVIIREKNDALAQNIKLMDQNRQFEYKIIALEKSHAAAIESLRLEVQFKDEQINAKRSLFMENHPNLMGGRTSFIWEPDPTPASKLKSSTKLQPSAKSFQPASLRDRYEQMEKPSRPSKLSHLRSDLPIGPTAPGQSCWSQQSLHRIVPGSRANCGSGSETEDEPGEGSLVPFKSWEQIAQEFSDAVKDKYMMIEEWTHKYTRSVNDNLAADKTASHSNELWEFMLSCTYINYGEAHDHTITLLRSETTRPFFVMRVIVQYLHLNIFKATAFSGMDPILGAKLNHVQAQLSATKIMPVERARLVSMQATILRSIVDNVQYPTWRTAQIHMHYKVLRLALGPLLDADAVRADAGLAIRAIVEDCFDLAAKMYTSNKTFVTTFPECGSKFQHPSMICRDINVKEDTLQLHIRQARIKLAISPTITMRDDVHGATIAVKTICDANVLIYE